MFVSNGVVWLLAAREITTRKRGKKRKKWKIEVWKREKYLLTYFHLSLFSCHWEKYAKEDRERTHKCQQSYCPTAFLIGKHCELVFFFFARSASLSNSIFCWLLLPHQTGPQNIILIRSRSFLFNIPLS